MKKYDGYALITGGSSGIGLEFAKALASRGYNLVLVARDENKLKKVTDDLKKTSSMDVIPIAQDLSKLDATDKIYDQLEKKKVHVGLLINNAGMAAVSPFHKVDRKYEEDMIETSCFALTELTYKFLPNMLQKKSGGVIFISSMAAFAPATPFNAVYGATRAYILKLGVSLHAEYKEEGVDILTVCPGIVDTPFHDKKETGRPAARALSVTDVVEKSLNSLGNKIILRIPSDPLQRILLSIAPFFPIKLGEILSLKYVNDIFKLTLK
jgi:hypothetical protein